MRGDPLRAAIALLAVLDKDADEDKRIDGALLLFSAMNDLALLRGIFIKLDGE